jgi:Sulfotransferase family
MMKSRKDSPVFVIGCHRSGTNLMYDTLLSAGGFAIYRASSPVYSTLIPLAGNLANAKNRERLMQLWLRSKQFRRSGLGHEEVRTKIQDECRNGGDFLRIVLGEVARHGRAGRWAVYDPDNILHIPTIKREVPDALFVHIVRDGRDIALSLSKMGGVRPLWWDGSRNLFAAGLNWQWMVRKGRRYGKAFPGDYTEIQYENLVNEPKQTLAQLAAFLDHDLDYDRVLRTGLGRVSDPNTTWKEESRTEFHPVGRWKEKLSPREISALEMLIGDCLEEFGYTLTKKDSQFSLDLRLSLMRVLYPRYFDAKLSLKSNTPLGRFASTNPLELTETPWRRLKLRRNSTV